MVVSVQEGNAGGKRKGRGVSRLIAFHLESRTQISESSFSSHVVFLTYCQPIYQIGFPNSLTKELEEESEQDSPPLPGLSSIIVTFDPMILCLEMKRRDRNLIPTKINTQSIKSLELIHPFKYHLFSNHGMGWQGVLALEREFAQIINLTLIRPHP